MCYTCGCKLPYERHGDKRNIIEDDLVDSGKTETVKKAGRKTAKQNMIELLEIQEKREELDHPKEDYN